MLRTLYFYFDYISPYAYLAWTQIHALASRCNCDVEPIPVVFAGLLNAHGQKGPAEIPAKRTYVAKDVIRIASSLHVPIQPPPTHPFHPILSLRISSLPLPKEQKKTLIDTFFRAVWGGGPGVDKPDVVASLLTKIGQDATTLLQQAESLEIKQKLRDQTDAAIAAGVFGVPTMRVDNEIFWGFDSLPKLEFYIQGNDPITAETLHQWERLEASATRTPHLK